MVKLEGLDVTGRSGDMGNSGDRNQVGRQGRVSQDFYQFRSFEAGRPGPPP